jgi:hypothetical protein
MKRLKKTREYKLRTRKKCLRKNVGRRGSGGDVGEDANDAV